MLLPQHSQRLNDSAISPEVARARGYRSAENGDQLERLGFKKYQRGAGLIIPIYDCHGEIASYQLRPNNPRPNSKGVPRKYENIGGSKIVLDVNPAVQHHLRDKTVPLDIAEGPLKGDAGDSKGLCCVALIGVYGWKRDGKPLPDLIDAMDRIVFIDFDSDVADNPHVAQARDGLTVFLQERGARVYHTVLLPAADGSKVGFDDYFAAGHTVEELRALATPAPLAARVTLSLIRSVGEASGANTEANTEDKPWTSEYASSLLNAGHTAAFVGVYAKLRDVPPRVVTESIVHGSFPGAQGDALEAFHLSRAPQTDWSGKIAVIQLSGHRGTRADRPVTATRSPSSLDGAQHPTGLRRRVGPVVCGPWVAALAGGVVGED
jgi:hypothetical protein